jgi:hypothetical protein
LKQKRINIETKKDKYLYKKDKTVLKYMCVWKYVNLDKHVYWNLWEKKSVQWMWEENSKRIVKVTAMNFVIAQTTNNK